ncbi:hypothetical protein [Saccharothrix xinjiangensis]|uniref:Uncharacterized protein n=1 Tax=Saccharothrix xinjiangensis TaxID=204798 RepID=A0ABV9XS05_9PSEU
MRRRRPRSAAPSWAVLPTALALALTGCAETPGLPPMPTPTGLPVPTAVPLPAGSTALAPPTAHLVARPLAGPVGGEVRLSGDGYPAHGRVVFTFRGERVGDTTADAVGRFDGVPVRVPDAFRDAEPGDRIALGATSGPSHAEVLFVLTR